MLNYLEALFLVLNLFKRVSVSLLPFLGVIPWGPIISSDKGFSEAAMNLSLVTHNYFLSSALLKPSSKQGTCFIFFIYLMASV